YWPASKKDWHDVQSATAVIRGSVFMVLSPKGLVSMPDCKRKLFHACARWQDKLPEDRSASGGGAVSLMECQEFATQKDNNDPSRCHRPRQEPGSVRRVRNGARPQGSLQDGKPELRARQGAARLPRGGASAGICRPRFRKPADSVSERQAAVS